MSSVDTSTQKRAGGSLDLKTTKRILNTIFLCQQCLFLPQARFAVMSGTLHDTPLTDFV